MFEIVDNLSPLTQMIIVVLLLGFAIFAIRSPKIVKSFNSFFSTLIRKKIKEIKTYEDLNNMLKTYGYSYDVKQDMFISNHDAWQRKMGYSRIFDEAAAPLSMIIDCEPIYFEYDDKRWLIEFWKGQYGMTTGCEIGVYYTDYPDAKLDDVNVTWYYCAEDNNMLNMSFALIRDGKTLMKRVDKHWWLTGFKLGKFSNPSELVMYLKVTLKDNIMRDEFIKGLSRAGYNHNEIVVSGNTIGLIFQSPKTKQPFTRIKEIDDLTQSKNKLLCDKYIEITSGYDNILDKLSAVQRLDPVLFQKLFSMGKPKGIFSEVDNIKASLEWL